MLHSSISTVEYKGEIGIRSYTYVRRANAVPYVLRSSMSIKRNTVIRKTAIEGNTLVKVGTAILSGTRVNRKTVVTTNTMIARKAGIPTRRV